MILKTSAGDFVAEFKHLAAGDMWRWSHMTCCALSFGTQTAEGISAPSHLTWGVAKCSRADMFSRAVGRKVALSRALSDTHPWADKNLRREAWESYFAQVSRRGKTAKSVLKRPRKRQNGNGR